MKLMALADIHQWEDKWRKLVRVCKKEQPDVIAIAGDIFPKLQGLKSQVNFVSSLFKYAVQIKDVGADLVLILGNDDNELVVDDMLDGEKRGLWHYVSDSFVDIDGYYFCGCPWVPDHPFGYKAWVRKETDDLLRINYSQRSKPLFIDENNKVKKIRNFSKWLREKSSIKEYLESLADQVPDIKKSIWLIHAPPNRLGLDHCSSGDKPGSISVRRFIEKYQPFLTLHGHIHESPVYSGTWKVNLGDTLCVQPGQISPDLYYVVMDINDGKISNIKHSEYGKYNPRDRDKK